MNRFQKELRKTILAVLAVMLLITSPVAAMQPAENGTSPQTATVQAQGAYAAPFICAYDPQIDGLLNQTSQEQWLGWIRKLSGAEEVTVEGRATRITSRYSGLMFGPNPLSPAYTYLLEQIQSWYPQVQIEEDLFYGNADWKNLIVTIPGTVRPDEIVIMSAHFDSTSTDIDDAPGADDNGSGSAALLEAARLLKDQRLERTVKLIWFTGEEQGLYGSSAYVNDHDLSGVVGVVNLDMYAYDGDNDRCFELHVSRDTPTYAAAASASNRIGQCFVNSIQAYGLDLKYDYFVGNATDRSDHANFWSKGIGAIEVGENFFFTSTPGGCSGSDMNPDYHEPGDTVDQIDDPTMMGFDITRAALATVFSMADIPDVILNPEATIYMPIVNR